MLTGLAALGLRTIKEQENMAQGAVGGQEHAGEGGACDGGPSVPQGGGVRGERSKEFTFLLLSLQPSMHTG